MKIAFVFPGQGSQSIGMLDAFIDHEVIKETLRLASDALEQNITELISHGPVEQLNLTANTQPVMLAADIALYRLWLARGGPVPVVVAGHSLGEYASLTASAALDFAQALRLVRTRANAMQSAVPLGTGGMAAILGLSDDAVRAACIQAQEQFSGKVVEAVNFNAPEQVVIAGHKEAVLVACDIARSLGAKRALDLPVSAPFHASLMYPAAQVLASALKNTVIKPPSIPLINNVDVALESDPQRISDALVRQAYHPVRWVETIQHMSKLGITHIVECGPGKVLSGLSKRIDKQIISLNLSDPVAFEHALNILQQETNEHA